MTTKLTSIAGWIVRLTGPTQVLLGLLFWTGRAQMLLPLHMLIGMMFVLALWALDVLAGLRGLHWALVLLTVGWGLLIPAFGMIQTRLLPGPGDWAVQVVHLLIGLVAMFVAARLVRFLRSNPCPDPVLAVNRPVTPS
jgi:hypothetical protein